MRERKADIDTERETQISRDNVIERNLEMRVHFAIQNLGMSTI